MNKCRNMLVLSTKIAFIFLFFLVGFSPVRTVAQPIVIGTYNIRYDAKNDSGNLWKSRGAVVAELIRFHDFDVLGTQEGLKNQLEDIITALPAYAYYGAGRDDGKDAGEHSSIFVKKDRFTVLKYGNFWLSQTPDSASMGWDAKCCKRICSWVYLKDIRTKKKFYVFNAHYDHEGKVARAESSNLVLQRIKKIAGDEPAIFCGDLNGSRTTECYQIIAKSAILKDTYTQVMHPYVNNGSFNGFGKTLDQDVIDHVFVTKQFSATRWGVLTDTYQGKYPSDHFPVLVNLEFRKL